MRPRADHVWVRDVQVWGDRKAPGLLLAWQQDESGAWWGWVVVAQLGIEARGDGPYVKQAWVEADKIEPFDAENAPPSHDG